MKEENGLYGMERGTIHAAMGIRKKYDGNFIVTFAVLNVRYDSITTKKDFKYGNYLKWLSLFCFLLLDCFYPCLLVFYLCFKSYYFINHKYII